MNIHRIIEETEAFDLSLSLDNEMESGPDGPSYGEDRLVKFAEAIIKECAEICRCSNKDLAEIIEKHFEIE